MDKILGKFNIGDIVVSENINPSLVTSRKKGDIYKVLDNSHCNSLYYKKNVCSDVSNKNDWRLATDLEKAAFELFGVTNIYDIESKVFGRWCKIISGLKAGKIGCFKTMVETSIIRVLFDDGEYFDVHVSNIKSYCELLHKDYKPEIQIKETSNWIPKKGMWVVLTEDYSIFKKGEIFELHSPQDSGKYCWYVNSKRANLAPYLKNMRPATEEEIINNFWENRKNFELTEKEKDNSKPPKTFNNSITLLGSNFNLPKKNKKSILTIKNK
jgi:hypothetical protein